MKLLLLIAVLAGPKTLAPAATLPVGKTQLKTWGYCAAKSTVAVMAGPELVSGRLDLGKNRLTLSSADKVDSWAMAFSRDCTLLADSESVGDDRARTHSYATWRVTDGKMQRLATFGPFPLPVSSLALTEDGAWLVVAERKKLSTWKLDAKTGAATLHFEAPPLPGDDLYLHVAASHGVVLAGTYEGKVQLKALDSANGALSPGTDLMKPIGPTREEGSFDSGAIVMPGGARVFDVAFSNEGKRAWAVVESGQVFGWDLEKDNGTRVTVVDGLSGANMMAISEDGTRLAAGGNFEARAWKLDGFKATLLGELGGLARVEKYVSTQGMHWLDAKHLGVGTGDHSSGNLVLYAF